MHRVIVCTCLFSSFLTSIFFSFLLLGPDGVAILEAVADNVVGGDEAVDGDAAAVPEAVEPAGAVVPEGKCF